MLNGEWSIGELVYRFNAIIRSYKSFSDLRLSE